MMRRSPNVSPKSMLTELEVDHHVGKGHMDPCPSSPSIHAPLLSFNSYQLPRFSFSNVLSSPVSYPYPLSISFGHKLRGALRQRRRSSLTRLAHRRAGHILIYIALPLFFFLLVREWELRDVRLSAMDFPPDSLHTIPTVDLQSLRGAYEVERRTGIVRERSSGTLRKRDNVDLEKMEQLGWTADEEARLQDEIHDIWPEWWGNIDKVGSSPFDHVPKILGQRRMLFLTDYTDYLERMNTHTYEIVDAALRHPNVIVDVWGPGWKGYERSVPLSANIKRRQARVYQLEQSRLEHERARFEKKGGAWFGQRTDENGEELGPWIEPEWQLGSNEMDDQCGPIHFDVVFTVSDIFKQNDPHVDVLDCGSLLVQQSGDCHSWRCFKEWYPMANNITLSKYAFELPEIFDYRYVKEQFPDFEMGIFGHSPDTANEWDFWPLSWKERNTQATMFGYDGSFYPIRTTVTDYMWGNDKATITRHEHPGYTLSIPDSARQQPLETYTKGHPLYVKHEALRQEFARGMRESKICVFDASLERKMIRKYAQALLSGCVIAADLPTEHEEALDRFVIKLKPSWTIERIKEEIEKYLAQPDKLHQMALDGFIYARQYLTTTRKVSDIIRMADAHKAGVRGYDTSLSDVEPIGVTMRIDRLGAAKKEQLGDWRAKLRLAGPVRKSAWANRAPADLAVFDEMREYLRQNHLYHR